MMTTRFMIPRGGPGEADHVVISADGRSFKIMKGVEYVVREKGEWEVEWRVDYVDPFGETEEVPVAICPKCGEEEYATAYDEYWAKPSNFCPNCGADMRKGENG